MDYSVNVEQGKLAREMRDTDEKIKTQTHKDLQPLAVRDMVYMREEGGDLSLNLYKIRQRRYYFNNFFKCCRLCSPLEN